MDAQGRGRADNIDPADQWVLNPDTGEYELRLTPSAPQSPIPGPRRPASPGTGDDGAVGGRGATPGRQQTRAADAPARTVPGPRRRRGAPPEEPPPGRRGRRPEKKKPKAKKALLWTGGTMAFVLVGVGTAGYLVLKHLEGNVTTTDVGGAAKAGFSKDEAFNILIIGTDKRTGKGNEGYGDKGSPGHADTNVLLHVSKDRTNATALSIPRDLVVDIPDCPTKQPDGTTKVVPGTVNARFNVSLGQDGRDPGCAMRTVKEVTGIAPDHFMMADFNAVKTLTTAVGGVDVCLKHAVKDTKSHLDLPAGESTIEGEDALAFVRTRHAWGNQGDLDRIKVQQQFLSSLMRKMASGDTLTDPAKLYSLANAATKALTVDTGIGKVSTLKDVALELKKVPTKNITFLTVPVLDNPADGAVKKTVIVDPSSAPPVFDAIANDVSFTEVKKKKKAKKNAEVARLKGTQSEASEVRVRILNGGAEAGSAQETLSWLQTSQGVSKSENAGNAPEKLGKTTLVYDADQAPQARKLAAIMGLPGSALKLGESVTNSQGLPTMTLTLGKDFKGAGVSLIPPEKAPEVKGQSTADKVECAS
ncbi:LytR family transcriptional regulator [Streptomyces sp. NTH33]|uniref:LCP family protein n=1 Tax=Streptomyces sp. NTH33 TaxID=1735453 RepID=UPI000DAA62B3|nr:LCP family protein [Streptomyces sp. NTH33]PZH15760.1 LytR family transcriptional regulator [Streptomyces sp. NTH33]